MDIGIIASMIIASLMGMIESVGDYYILARACKKPTPPKHALNRGLAMEGVINLICGSLNMGYGTTTYSQTIAFMKTSGVNVTENLFNLMWNKMWNYRIITFS